MPQAGSSTRPITLNLRSGPLHITGRDSVLGFVLPNVHFRATAAYAMLPHNGLDIGKRGCLGKTEPMKPPDALHDAEINAPFAASRALAWTLNTGDCRALLERCCPDIELDTQSMLEPIFGREVVGTYLETQLAIARAERRPWRAELGTLDAEYPALPGVVLLQGDAVQAFWAPTPDADGRIQRIFGYTRVPPPTSAVRLGELPGAAPGHGQPDAQRSEFARQRAAFRSSEGPLRFHGFCVSAQVAESWLKPRLDTLRQCFPGSEAHVHVHDPIGAGFDPIEAQANQVGRFGIATYPTICVERGGKVFRSGGAPQDLARLVEDVRGLLGP